MDGPMVICDMEVSRAYNIIYVYPQGHFFKQAQIYLFNYHCERDSTYSNSKTLRWMAPMSFVTQICQ